MYFNDHNPPHFHARCGSQEAVFSLATLGVIDGELPPRQMGMVVEWAASHREELQQAWDRARQGQLPMTIKPLD